MPEMAIGGIETIRPILGGTVLEMAVDGDETPGMGSYQGWGALAWDTHMKRYRSLWLDNMGQAGLADCHAFGNDFIIGGTNVMMGTPLIERSIMQCNEDGQLVGMVSHVISGAADPYKSFEAKLTLQK